MEKKQTAVDWLLEQLENQGYLYDLDIEAAKEMEKEQIIDAYLEGESDAEHLDNSAENYYNETYLK